jgi:hypothetical protein
MLNSPLTFEWISWVECLYIPSWLILDENLKVVEMSCWNEKSLEDIKETLDNLLK